MIESPYQYVTPDQELTWLTLMTTAAAENIKRRSTVRLSQPLETLNGLPVHGPSLPPSDAVDEAPLTDHDRASKPNTEMTSTNQLAEPALGSPPTLPDAGPLRLSSADDRIGLHDNSSEVTLVSTPSPDDSTTTTDAVNRSHMYDSDTKGDIQSPPRSQSVENALVASPSQSLASCSTPHARPPTSSEAVPVQQAQSTDVSNSMASSAPPPPPRPLVNQTAVPKAPPTLEEYARQQDVSEVLNHVLFQLSCAMKPTGFEDSGEQIDRIKELFYGRTKQHVMSEEPEAAQDDIFCSIIVRLYSRPPDIYAALDGFFDVEEIANKKRFLSISQLPPIFQIQIDRASVEQRKLNHHVELRETIYLDRYLEPSTNPALMERRQEMWRWKRELADLEARQGELAAGPVGSLPYPNEHEDGDD